MNQKRFTNIVLVIIIVVLVGAAGYFASNNQKTPASVPAPGANEAPSSTPGPKNNSETVSLGQRFTLKKNQFIKIVDTGLEVGIIQFYNSPCPGPNDPEGTVCFWSGVGIEFEYRYNGEVLGGINRVTAFGYQINVVKTDYETYASLVVNSTQTPQSKGDKVIRMVGEREGSFSIQKINSDSVDGLWYDIYPIVRSDDPGTPKTLHMGDDIGYACEGVSEKLTSIDFSGQTITFTKVVGQPPYGGCPKCLAGNTLIDTLSGLVAVKDLQVGMPIWTIDKTGNRISGVVTKTSKVSVPPTHQMVHLILDDGRELLASPGHPTIDGRNVGDLALNDLYDGASVVSVQRVSYSESATYDVLPSGETGFYWANGVLFGSTLSHK